MRDVEVSHRILGVIAACALGVAALAAAPAEHANTLDIVVGNGPHAGTHGEIAFQGKTKDGVQLRVLARCRETAEF